MTAAGIAKEIGVAQININHVYCEWMSEMFFDHNHLPNLMSRRSDLYSKESIVRDYLAGIDYKDEGLGLEESHSYFPEDQEKCKERNQRNIEKLYTSYDE